MVSDEPMNRNGGVLFCRYFFEVLAMLAACERWKGQAGGLLLGPGFDGLSAKILFVGGLQTPDDDAVRTSRILAARF